jgi:hypothetical protein
MEKNRRSEGQHEIIQISLVKTMFRRTGPTDPANFQLLIILAQEQAWTTGFDEFVYFFLRQRTIPNCEFVDATSQRTIRMAPARRG